MVDRTLTIDDCLNSIAAFKKASSQPHNEATNEEFGIATAKMSYLTLSS